MQRQSPNTLQVRLGALASVQIIHDLEESAFLFTIVENGVVQRRTVVRIEKDQALKIASFLLGSKGPPLLPEPEEVTSPGR